MSRVTLKAEIAAWKAHVNEMRKPSGWMPPEAFDQKIKIGVLTTDEGVMKRLRDPRLWQEALSKFVQMELVGETGQIYRLFHSMMTKDYLPKIANTQKGNLHDDLVHADKQAEGADQYLVKRRQLDDERTLRLQSKQQQREQGMYRGFADLWRAVSVFQIGQSDNSITAGIGPRNLVESLRLSEYMRMGGSSATNSPLNSLFYGVEFGTGIADNVGSGNVRLDGYTKDFSEDGSWWLGSLPGRGLHFLGQKGFHFLYDARTRRPQEYIRQVVQLKLPQYVLDALRSTK